MKGYLSWLEKAVNAGLPMRKRSGKTGIGFSAGPGKKRNKFLTIIIYSKITAVFEHKSKSVML